MIFSFKQTETDFGGKVMKKLLSNRQKKIVPLSGTEKTQMPISKLVSSYSLPLHFIFCEFIGAVLLNFNKCKVGLCTDDNYYI